jgi:MYXO-CTERM domain-containing protein
MALPPIDRLVDVRSVLSDRRLAAALALGAGLWAAPAAAHIELTSPAARYSGEYQKAPPCGHPDNPPGAGPVATYQAGETITIVFDETVDHAGHFRIALDPTGTDSFTLPTGFQDFYNSPEVLLDNIPDMAGGTYSVEVTLPDTPCDPCTLQLIQVMNDGAWGPGDSDLYFNCADIVIEGAAGETGEPTTGADGTGGESSGGGDVGSGDPDTGPGGSSGEGGSSGGGGAEGPGDGSGGTGLGSSGPADADDEAGGCSCRTERGTPAAAAPWLLMALVAWRRRRG